MSRMLGRFIAAAAIVHCSTALAAEHGAEKAGLPQLNAQDFAPQLIWLAITFIALYYLMSSVALPRVGSAIEARADRISKDLSEAHRLKTETEQALSSYEQALAAARGQAQKLVQENRDRIAADTTAERAKVDAKVSAMIAQAEGRIAIAKTQAMGQVSQIANEAARSIVTQLIGQSTSAEEATRALAGLGQSTR